MLINFQPVIRFQVSPLRLSGFLGQAGGREVTFIELIELIRLIEWYF